MLTASWLLYAYHDKFWYPPDEGNYAHVAQRMLEGETSTCRCRTFIPATSTSSMPRLFACSVLDLLSLRYPLVFAGLSRPRRFPALFPGTNRWRAAVAVVAATALGAIQFLNPTAHWPCLALSRFSSRAPELVTNRLASSSGGNPDWGHCALPSAHWLSRRPWSLDLPLAGGRQPSTAGPTRCSDESSPRR